VCSRCCGCPQPVRIVQKKCTHQKGIYHACKSDASQSHGLPALSQAVGFKEEQRVRARAQLASVIQIDKLLLHHIQLLE
jgi:hypothetical protein